MLTSKEYAGIGGTKCPCCGRFENIEGNDWESDAGIAWQHITCLDCGATWRDEYILEGYGDLEPGEDSPTS